MGQNTPKVGKMKYENEGKFEELAQKLEKMSKHNQKFNAIIYRCRTGAYHDFLSNLATPKMQMVTDLRAAGLEDDAQAVINGEYDQ